MLGEIGIPGRFEPMQDIVRTSAIIHMDRAQRIPVLTSTSTTKMSSFAAILAPTRRRALFFIQKRTYVDLNRPMPPPLPPKEQREFEELQRKALEGTPDAPNHPDAPTPVKAEFEGEINPATGERGGPKREPVGKWTDEGDWSFKGRVSDF